jgi:hypothetical protein
MFMTNRQQRVVPADGDGVHYRLFTQSFDGPGIDGIGDSLLSVHLKTEIVERRFVLAHTFWPPTTGDGADKLRRQPRRQGRTGMNIPLELLGPFAGRHENRKLTKPRTQGAPKPQVFAQRSCERHQLGASEQRDERPEDSGASEFGKGPSRHALCVRHPVERQGRQTVVSHRRSTLESVSENKKATAAWTVALRFDTRLEAYDSNISSDMSLEVFADELGHCKHVHRALAAEDRL